MVDRLLSIGLASLITASTLNGFAVDWRILGAEITIHPDQGVLVLLMPLVAYAWWSGRLRLTVTRFDWLVAGFLVCNAASSLLMSPSPRASLQGTVLLAGYAAMYFVVRLILANRQAWSPIATNWLIALGIAQAVFAVVALLLYSAGFGAAGVQEGHLIEGSVALEGTFWEPNLLGAYAALVAVFCASRFLLEPSGERGRPFLFGLFIASLVLPLTLTRAAGLGFAAGMAAVAVAGWRFRREIRSWGRRMAVAGLVLGGVFLLTATVIDDFVSNVTQHPNFLVERWTPDSWIPAPVQTPGTAAERPETGRAGPRAAASHDGVVAARSRSSVEGRLDAWRRAVESWRASPILGHGTLAGTSIVAGGWWYSSLVQALHDTGILGLALLVAVYLGAILLPLMACIRSGPSLSVANLMGFSAGNAILLLTSQFSSFLFVGFPWVFLGLTIAVAAGHSKTTLSTP